MFSMLHMLSFYNADTVFECCMDRQMGDVAALI